MRAKFLSVVFLTAILTITAQTVDSLPALPKTNVDIPWTELRGLIELSMKTVEIADKPPVGFIIPFAEYEATISGDALRGKIEIPIVILEEGYVEIPLFDQSLPLSSPLVDGRSAPIMPRNGKHTLILKGPGDFKFTSKFVMELAENVTNFRLNIPRTSSTRFKLTIPGTDLDVKLTPASKISSVTSGKSTVVEAFIPSTDYLYCEWMTALPEKIAEELEPIVYAEVRSLFSVGEGLVRGSSELSFSVVQGKVDVLRFQVPADVRILDVRSGNLRDWKMEDDGDLRTISAYLKFPTGGTIAVTCDYERSMKAVSATVNLPNIHCMAVEREKGYIGVEAKTNVEVSLLEESLESATRIDRSELPQALWGRASHPIILAFKYLETPYTITLDIEKHEDLPVKVATADDATFVAIVTAEGNYIVRGTYRVRNNLKQFLALKLPEDAELWSLFVSGHPAKPGKGEEGRVLIPMEKSRGGENATTFPVEIIYFVEGKKLGSFGHRKIILPKVDVPVSVMNLSLYLPYGYTYPGFGGNMQEGFSDSWSRGRGYGLAAGDASMDYEESNVAPQAAKMNRMMESQVQYEDEMKEVVHAVFSSTEKGVMPVRISIPQVGALHRFQKFIVPEDEDGPFTEVKVRYTKRGIKSFLTFVVVILSLIGFYMFAKSLNKFFDKLITKKKNPIRGLINTLIVGFILIFLLSLIANAFSVNSSAISVPWILGGMILIIYVFGKFIVDKSKEKKLARKQVKAPKTPEPHTEKPAQEQ